MSVSDHEPAPLTRGNRQECVRRKTALLVGVPHSGTELNFLPETRRSSATHKARNVEFFGISSAQGTLLPRPNLVALN